MTSWIAAVGLGLLVTSALVYILKDYRKCRTSTGKVVGTWAFTMPLNSFWAALWGLAYLKNANCAILAPCLAVVAVWYWRKYKCVYDDHARLDERYNFWD